MKTAFYIYLIGCFFALGGLKFCIWITPKDLRNGLTKYEKFLGSLGSWPLFFYILYGLIKGFFFGKVPNIPKKLYLDMSDAEMVQVTIDDYWVKAIQDPEFDPHPSVPLKDSPLCKKYLNSSYRGESCIGCPIHKANLECKTQWSIFNKYALSATRNARKDRAINCAKMFENIYKELLAKKVSDAWVDTPWKDR